MSKHAGGGRRLENNYESNLEPLCSEQAGSQERGTARQRGSDGALRAGEATAATKQLNDQACNQEYGSVQQHGAKGERRGGEAAAGQVARGDV